MALFNEIAGSAPNPTGGGIFSQIEQGQPAPTQSFGDRLLAAIKGGYNIEKDVATGVSKAGVSTVQGLGQLVLKGTDALGVTKNMGNQTFGGPQNPDFLAPKNTAEKVGEVGEHAAEYFIPAGIASKGEKVVDLLSRGLSSPTLGALTRIAGKSIVQGVAAGAVNLAQTGGDFKSAKNTALTAGAARGAIATGGEIARGFNLPERLYSTIFKNSKSDMLQELNANGISALQKNNPEAFKKFVDEGLIKVTEGGRPILNNTVAEDALNKGLKGSIRGMANEVVSKTLESESLAKDLARNYSGTVSFPEKQYIKVLDEVAAQYENVGFGDLSKEANRLAGNLEISQGELSAEDALSMRRLLDKLRIASSFNPSNTNLSLSQSNFKFLADEARKRVNSIPGMGEVMKNYSFYIDAMDALAKEATRRGNNQIISLIDSIFLGGALNGKESVIPLSAAALARRVLVSAPGATRLGSALNNPIASPVLGGMIGAGSGGVQSLQKAPQ